MARRPAAARREMAWGKRLKIFFGNVYRPKLGIPHFRKARKPWASSIIQSENSSRERQRKAQKGRRPIKRPDTPRPIKPPLRTLISCCKGLILKLGWLSG